MAKNKDCYCGNKGVSLENCCLPLHNGERIAQTPEELMRSRYSAYVLNDLQYIENTMCGIALSDYKSQSAVDSSSDNAVKWLKLEIISTSNEQLTGVVEFKAYYRVNKRKYCLHEVSEFQLVNGRWLYSAAREFIE